MNLTRVKQALRKVIPKKFRKPTPIEQRAEIRKIKQRILADPPLGLLDKIEDLVKLKGKKSKELSILKARVAMDFNEKHFGIKLDPKKREQAAELMQRIEQREKAVAFVGRKKTEDELTIELKKELQSLFKNKNEFTVFVTTYRLYSSEINLLLKESGY